MTTVDNTTKWKGRGQGFASFSPEKMREVGRKGGKAAQASGKAHRWTSETAAIAGRKGGSVSKRKGGQEA